MGKIPVPVAIGIAVVALVLLVFGVKSFFGQPDLPKGSEAPPPAAISEMRERGMAGRAGIPAGVGGVAGMPAAGNLPGMPSGGPSGNTP